MKSTLFIILIMIISTASANNKIVNGEIVYDISNAPFVVKFDADCGGSIINEEWILTAAHCDDFDMGGMMGSSELTNDQMNSFTTIKVIRHPNFNYKTMDNDFALIKVKRKFDFNNVTIAPIKLATPDEVAQGLINAGTVATVYGWGLIKEDDYEISFNLRKVDVPLVSNETANAAISYNGEILSSMIAAGFVDGGKDSCQGDSGGPLVVENKMGEPVLIGVVSWGEGCARANKYGIYSNVAKAYDWIMSTVASN